MVSVTHCFGEIHVVFETTRRGTLSQLMLGRSHCRHKRDHTASVVTNRTGRVLVITTLKLLDCHCQQIPHSLTANPHK